MTKHFYKKEMKIPIYFGKFTIILSNDEDKINDFICQSGERVDPHYFGQAICFIKGTWEQYVMLLNPFLYELTPGVVAHEAFHLTNMLFRQRGVIPDATNDESQAYLIQWFVDKAYDFIDKTGVLHISPGKEK